MLIRVYWVGKKDSRAKTVTVVSSSVPTVGAHTNCGRHLRIEGNDDKNICAYLVSREHGIRLVLNEKNLGPVDDYL